MSETMKATHKASMNLRFVEREITEPVPGRPELAQWRRMRVLQQMMVPHDWTKHEEFWQDVPCFNEADLTPNDGGQRSA